MAELVASLILRLRDQWSGPARAAAGALGSLERAAGGFGQAGSVAARNAQRLAGSAAQVAGSNRAATAATAALTAATTTAAGSSLRLTGARTAEARASASGARAADAAAKAQGASADAASGAGRAADAQASLASATARSGEAAEASYSRFSRLERMQLRGAAAGRAMGSEFGRLQGRLGALAMGTIVTDGMARAGDAVLRPMQSAVQRAAEYQRMMLGIGVLADLRQDQLREVSANTFATAQKLGLPLNLVLEHDRAVLNEGVYRESPASLNHAARAASRLSMLAEATGAPITAPQSGALISTYAHTLNAPVDRLDHLNAILMRASQLGGDKVGDVARFMPKVMAQLKGSAYGNEAGFKDAAAMFQVVKRVTGDDESAGTATNDFLVSLTHRLTQKRFAQAGINLDKIRLNANRQHRDPMLAIIEALRSKVGDNPNDPLLTSKIAHFFQNQWAQQAAQAFLLFSKDQPGSMSYGTLRRKLDAPDLDRRYSGSIDTLAASQSAGMQRAENAKDRASITTGNTLDPLTRAVNAFNTRSAGALNDVQGGAAGRALVRAAALAGGAAAGIGRVGQVAVGVATPIIIGRSLLRMSGLGARVGAGKAARVAERVITRTVPRPAAQATTRAAQAATRPVTARTAQAAATRAARAAQAATRPVAARASQATTRAVQAASRATEGVAGAALRSGLIGRLLGGALRVAGPVGEALALRDTLRDARRNVDTNGAAALAWLRGDRRAYAAAQRASGRPVNVGAMDRVALPPWASRRAWITSPPLPAQHARPEPGRSTPAAGFRPAPAEPPPHAPVAELAAFARSLSADAAAMLAHARALGALATAEVAAAGRVATAARAPVPVAATPAPAAATRPAATPRHVENHFHIHGSSDPHATGRAAARAARAEEHRALHDGADG